MPETSAEEHPLRKWLRDNDVSYRMAAARCRRALKNRTSSKYIEQIAIGWQRPGFAIARYISETLTDGKVNLEELLLFPYRRPPNPNTSRKVA